MIMFKSDYIYWFSYASFMKLIARIYYKVFITMYTILYDKQNVRLLVFIASTCLL